MNRDGKTALFESGDEIVISGIAGRFPKSDNIKHLQENLLNNVDLGSDDCQRWQHEHMDVPRRTGKVNNIEKFDAEYFDMPFNQAHLMDPMCRCLLEHTYEAIVDAGINPKDLRNTKTGVIVGACYTETERIFFYEKVQVAGLGLLGIKSMLANLISRWLSLKGPSCLIDTACSSSLSAMERAYRIIRSGECDAMIVAGTNLCLNPFISLQFARLGVLSPDGFCRPFDRDANGYMRSETIAAVFLQKAKNAKRIYASVVYAKMNCDGFKEQGITFPSSEMQGRLLEEFYNECGVSPSCISYLEAHGTATKVGDPEEVNAIERVFCKDERSPLLIGSVKSNLGHSEPASGMCQIAKVVIAMEIGIIPPNLHFTKERDDIEAFKPGTVRVVTTPTTWEPTLVGINSFGFGGANTHILLEPNMKQKVNGGAPKDDLQRLAVLSGRTEQAVESFLREIGSQLVDVEYVRLLHELHAEELLNHPYRGYTIAENQISSNVTSEIHHYDGVRKPICFVFPGIGSQWLGMGEALLRFPAFSKAVKDCDAILRAYGVNIINILTSKMEDTFDSILNSIVGITMMQLGLIDLLTSVNIVPDYVIGNSIGELCCGYVTGEFTAEQVILSAYYIGLALSEVKTIQCAKVDIGLDYKSLKAICPADIEIICSYSPNACSINGPIESVKIFVTKLQDSKVPTKVVACSNIPLHTSYLANATPRISSYLYQTISQKMTRSQIWRRSPCDYNLSYAEYFTNCLGNHMFFEDVAKMIPENAAFVKIAPDGILQDISNKIFDTTNITLAQRHHVDNAKEFLQGLGKIYNCGSQPQLANLYPAVEFPVSRGTPMISPSIKWKHSEDWYVAFYSNEKCITSGERIIRISLSDEDHEYMNGHVIDGRKLVPATGYIFFIWETVAMLKGQWQSNVPVVFEDIKFLRATHMSSQGNVELTLMVQKASGIFEIIEGNTTIVTGKVRVPSDPAKERIVTDFLQNDDDEEEVMKTKDVYKELKLRGYQYTGVFRGIKSSSIMGTRGHIAWLNNWVAFMDNILQMHILGTDTSSLYVPTGIGRMVIDPQLHAQHIQDITNEDKQLAVCMYKKLDTIVSGGIEINGISATPILRRKPIGHPVLEEYKFVAHRDGDKVPFEDGIILSTHLALEYHQMTRVNIIELIEDGDVSEITTKELASPIFVEILSNLPLIQPNINLIARTNSLDCVILPPEITISQSKKLSKDDNAILVSGYNLLTSGKNDTLRDILQALKSGGFLLTRGQPLDKEDIATAESYNLAVVLEKQTEKEHITLLKKRGQSTSKTDVIFANNHEFSWVEQLKLSLSEENKLTNTTRIIIVGEGDTECGLLGLVNCLRKEPGGELIRGVFIQDENAPKFSLHDPFYAEQLRMDLIINVLRPEKVWGSYRHLPLAPLKSKLVHHAFVNQMVHGDLSSFYWIEGPINLNYEHPRFVNIIYATLNFKDVMTATGKIKMERFMSRGRMEDCMIGLEYVGIDDTGRKIMGLAENKCISNMQVFDQHLSWEIPDGWTLEDAATIPCAYSTFYYGLSLGRKLRKSDKILIHSGTGAVGQAAINIALHEGCEVFTTVGTLEKRKFIRDTFPSIPEDHIGNSRDTSFEQMINQQTKGRGVDVVLNSLAEDKLQASVRCLARNGRFLEIGKFDILSNNTLDMSIFSKGIKFYSIMLDKIFSSSFIKKSQLNNVLREGLDNGAVKPLIRTIFQKDEVETAFRYMAAGKHIGKIVIKIQEEGKFMNTPLLALPRYYCLPNRSYIILGGLGGFGLELADWLVVRGARNLVLISRTGLKNGYQRMKVELWKSYGVKVLIVSNVDASDIKDCEYILRTAEELAPTDAIFNLAVVLNDKICQNHTIETFQEPFKAKAWATKNLDQLSRCICPELRHFVVFSSVSCGRGNAGQSNYGMANSIMERICERRTQEGLHGLAIQWGAIGDVGIVADMQEDDKEMVIGGTLQQKISSCIEKLEEFLLQKQPVVASMVVAEKRSSAVSSISVVDTVANIMSLKDLSTVSAHARLSEIGMDSMMAVEIKQTLEREYEVFLTAQDIRNLNFAKLAEMFNQETLNEKLRSDNLKDSSDLAGLKLLVRVIGDDNYSIPDVCISLPTKADTARDEIFLLPGVEGCWSIFNLLAPKIEAPAVCLQYGTYNIGNDCHTISEIADCLLKHITDRIKSRKNFVIVAYSFGTIIGIELVRRLEEMSLRGRLVLIDGAPEQMKALASQHLPFTTIDELQNNVLLGITDMLQPAVSGKLLLELNKFSNWDDKLNVFMSHIPPTYRKMSIDYSKATCTTVYKHIQALHKYDVTQIQKIVSSVILLKPTMQSLRVPDEDYGLHKITTGRVQIHSVEGNHITILDSDKVVAAINGQQIEGVKKTQSNIIDDKPIISVESNRTRS
ncbi:Fatty acid synthase [Harpegnathos saltator]|uniref:Fatty acid synthase n=1 Tax=Harpegnathos saltator TaxID=610380 RepID=E2BR60_HARSA|nr:Fatty acid synthase [Harpegnathos saltator]